MPLSLNKLHLEQENNHSLKAFIGFFFFLHDLPFNVYISNAE